jgi:hypothetical protein
MWLTHLIWIFGSTNEYYLDSGFKHEKTQKTLYYPNIKKHNKHFGLGTQESHHGWQQRWPQGHQEWCNSTFLHATRCLQNM